MFFKTSIKISVLSLAFFILHGTGLAAKQAGTSHVLPRTGQISCYDGQGNPIDFSGSGQDGEYQRGRLWPVPRFKNNGDGTVTDKLTGLMWLKDGSCFPKMSWLSAVKAVYSLNKMESFSCQDYFANHTDWRLPELDELESLADAEESVVANFLKLSGFTHIQAQHYWTNTTYLNPLNSWYVDMADGTVDYQNKMTSKYVLPVRHVGQPDESELPPKKISDSQEAEDPLPEKEMEKVGGKRFVDNGDGTVSDTSTGLMWMKDAGCVKERTWIKAIESVEGLQLRSAEIQCDGYTAAYDDWTLPNRAEMRSIIDYTYDFPALEDSHPFVNLSPSYWTSTSSPARPDHAFSVQIYYGSVLASLKSEKMAGWPVREIVPHAARPRETSRSGLGEDVDAKYVLRIDPELKSEIRWPPDPRFIGNGDGTSMDRVTGYTWLTDANCFGKLSWDETFETIKTFNTNPRQYACEGYEVSFGDWMVPSIEELKELIGKKEKKLAAWLEDQGIVNLQAGGDYWSATPTLINLYYAYVLNFKNGAVHNYPKSLKFFFWPRRTLHQDTENHPLLNMTLNAMGERVQLKRSDPFSIAVYLHTFGIRQPADFWFWYETPDGQEIWLSPIRTWRTTMTPVYQGDLFNLKNYEIIRGDTEELEPGDYVFYFGVDFDQNGILDELRYQSRVILSIF